MADHGGSDPAVKAAAESVDRAVALDAKGEAPTREQLLAQITTLEDRLHQLESAHAAIVNSTIWRATEPLRRALRANRGLHAAGSGLVRRLLGENQARLESMSPAGLGARRPWWRRTARRGVDFGVRQLRRWPYGFALAERAAQRLGRFDPRIPDLLKAPQPAPASALNEQAASSRGITPPLASDSRMLILEFVWDKTASPVDYGGRDDTRALAAGFQELSVLAGQEGETDLLARIDFRTGGNSLAHVLFGYSFIESWGTWTSGSRSAVLLWLPASAPDTVVVDIAAGVFDAAFSEVEADVIANGVAAGRLRIVGGAPARIEAPLGPARLNGLECANNVSTVADARPDVSIISLNYNKPGITLASVLSVLRSQTQLSFEVIILDNGSTPDRKRALKTMDLPIRLIDLPVNRFFGEGNNIAAEHARAPLLCFLNNDAFMTDGALDALCEPLLSDATIGATGPVFRYPDGTLQEAGAFLNADGTAHQRGKFRDDFDVSALPKLDPVDYISAACLVIRADDFAALGGFDLRFDPAYYEDSDLCMRLRALGKTTMLARDALVTHVENATTSDPRNKGIATDIVERHRQIFLTRWGEWLADRKTAPTPNVESFDPKRLRQSVQDGQSATTVHGVFTPFALTHGGGERYILGAAQALSANGATAVITPDAYSALRLNTLMRDLGYGPYRVFPMPERDVPLRSVDRFILMGNELLPTKAAYGRSRVYHCQFPFPSDAAPASLAQHARNLASYQAVVVNSAFTRDAYARQIADAGQSAPAIEIIPPPVRLLTAPGTPLPEKEPLILCVGRFSPLGHSKRQDVIVNAFGRLKRQGALKGWRLALCGMVPNEPEAIAYYERLVEEVRGIEGASLMLAPSREQIETLMLKARIYVSATGFGVHEAKDAWKCEHFGITVAEAISAGCVPVAWRNGGPAEIIAAVGCGFTFGSARELETALLDAREASADAALLHELRDKAATYSQDAFFERVNSLFDTLT